MERLSGLDASFLYNETPSLHMHTLKYAVLDVRSVEAGFSLERLRSELGDRLTSSPSSAGGWSRCRSACTTRSGSRTRIRLEDHVRSVPCRHPAVAGRWTR